MAQIPSLGVATSHRTPWHEFVDRADPTALADPGKYVAQTGFRSLSFPIWVRSTGVPRNQRQLLGFSVSQIKPCNRCWKRSRVHKFPSRSSSFMRGNYAAIIYFLHLPKSIENETANALPVCSQNIPNGGKSC